MSIFISIKIQNTWVTRGSRVFSTDLVRISKFLGSHFIWRLPVCGPNIDVMFIIHSTASDNIIRLKIHSDLGSSVQLEHLSQQITIILTCPSSTCIITIVFFQQLNLFIQKNKLKINLSGSKSYSLQMSRRVLSMKIFTRLLESSYLTE